MEQKSCILVVDDEPGIVKIVGIHLKLCGYESLTATNGTDAVKLVESRKPDLMLLDMLMPDMSGLEVLNRVREFSRIPVIVFTANHNLVQEALEQGADTYVPKPFLPDTLMDKIKTVLEGQRPA